MNHKVLLNEKVVSSLRKEGVIEFTLPVRDLVAMYTCTKYSLVSCTVFKLCIPRGLSYNPTSCISVWSGFGGMER